MFLVVASIVIQALLIVHCIKTGRNTIWIWVIALLSYAGIIAYVAVELLPDLFRSRTTQRTVCHSAGGRRRAPNHLGSA